MERSEPHNEFASRAGGRMTPDELRYAAEKLYWYHCINLGQGVVTNGDFEMGEYLPRYHFPDDMTGLKVLDVGRASGYFAFEFERRGAHVVATEIASFLDWDFVGGPPERARRAAEIGDVAAFTHKNITGAFKLAYAARRSTVEPVTTTIYNISPETVGDNFDIVFAGSVTSHLRDPILGLERFRSVVAPDGVCIVSAPYVGVDESLPLAAMVGTSDTDRRSWWVVNKRCLIEMLNAAGFSRVEIVDHFDLQIRRQIDQPGQFPHMVAHARL
jgi:tRNA (mo5U34)-methyltransferase